MSGEDRNARRSQGFLVRGRVQGVGFRAFVRHHARKLGLVGTVRNLADERVEVLAHGTADQMDRLGALLAEGPAQSRVDGVETFHAPDDPTPWEFRITY